ncbi:MAG: DNA polymerase IV, partial [Pseudomonadota bacterium]
GGRVVTLKLKRADHQLITRRQTLDQPTQLADVLHRSTAPMLQRALSDGPFRLIGIGLGGITDAATADLSADLLDPLAQQRTATERATDTIRTRFGDDAIVKGRALN